MNVVYELFNMLQIFATKSILLCLDSWMPQASYACCYNITEYISSCIIDVEQHTVYNVWFMYDFVLNLKVLYFFSRRDNFKVACRQSVEFCVSDLLGLHLGKMSSWGSDKDVNNAWNCSFVYFFLLFKYPNLIMITPLLLILMIKLPCDIFDEDETKIWLSRRSPMKTKLICSTRWYHHQRISYLV